MEWVEEPSGGGVGVCAGTAVLALTPTAIASQPAALGTHVQAAQHRANTSETLVYEAKTGPNDTQSAKVPMSDADCAEARKVQAAAGGGASPADCHYQVSFTTSPVHTVSGTAMVRMLKAHKSVGQRSSARPDHWCWPDGSCDDVVHWLSWEHHLCGFWGYDCNFLRVEHEGKYFWTSHYGYVWQSKSENGFTGYHYCYVGDSLTPPYSAAIDTCAGQRNSNVDIQADEWFTAKASIHGITYSQEWRSLVREFAGGYTDYAVYRE